MSLIKPMILVFKILSFGAKVAIAIPFKWALLWVVELMKNGPLQPTNEARERMQHG